jgi:release factor glutamine methyltransferase
MNNEDLKKIYSIQKILEKNGYKDIQRISKEVVTYSTKNNIPLDKIFKAIQTGKPWEHIQGFTEFCNYNFKVTKDTLIPRIETEELVNITKEEIDKLHPTLVIDVGTGTGCIAIALAKIFEDSNIKFLATDISKKALKVAKYNARNLKAKNISFKKNNLIKDISPKEKFCIVTNLPYIPTVQYESLDTSVKNFEPKLALEGGENGLDLYEELFKQVSYLENKPLFISLEFEPSTKKDLKKLVERYFEDSNYTFKKDCFNKERFVVIYL